MKVTQRTRAALAWRRQEREMRAAGFELAAEPCWELNRGSRMTERIVEVRITTDGKGIWFRTEGPDKEALAAHRKEWAERERREREALASWWTS